jgi:hypothetical protein
MFGDERRVTQPTPLARAWRSHVAYVLCGALIVTACAGYYARTWPSYSDFSKSIDGSCMVPFCDFTMFYLKQARVILRQDEPIKKYFYSPTFALALTPLARLPTPRAIQVWAWIEGLSLALFLAGGIALLMDYPRWTHALFLLLTLTSYPILHNWKWGQANTTLMALIVISLALLERGALALAAFALALVTAARYYPAMFAVAFLRRKQWAGIAWFVGLCVVLLVLVPALAMGTEHARHFYDGSAAAIHRATRSWVASSRSSQYLPTLIARDAQARHAHAWLSRTVLADIGYALVAVNLFTAFRATRDSVPHACSWAFCFVAGSTPLFMPTSWMHYFVYLPLAQTFTLAEIVQSHVRVGFRVLLVACWLPGAAVSSVFFFQQAGGVRSYAERGYLSYANLAMLALCHLLFLRANAAAKLAGSR